MPARAGRGREGAGAGGGGGGRGRGRGRGDKGARRALPEGLPLPPPLAPHPHPCPSLLTPAPHPIRTPARPSPLTPRPSPHTPPGPAAAARTHTDRTRHGPEMPAAVCVPRAQEWGGSALAGCEAAAEDGLRAACPAAVAARSGSSESGGAASRSRTACCCRRGRRVQQQVPQAVGVRRALEKRRDERRPERNRTQPRNLPTTRTHGPKGARTSGSGTLAEAAARGTGCMCHPTCSGRIHVPSGTRASIDASSTCSSRTAAVSSPASITAASTNPAQATSPSFQCEGGAVGGGLSPCVPTVGPPCQVEDGLVEGRPARRGCRSGCGGWRRRRGWRVPRPHLLPREAHEGDVRAGGRDERDEVHGRRPPA